MTETTVQYMARKGARLSDHDARIVGPELDRISREHGADALTVVEIANDESSALHPYFDWDNNVAAANWRLTQARALMNSIEVVVKEADDKGPREMVRAFHIVKSRYREDADVERRYHPLDVVVTRDDWAQQVVAQARSDLLAFKRRYGQYQKYIREDEVLCSILDRIDELDDEN